MSFQASAKNCQKSGNNMRQSEIQRFRELGGHRRARLQSYVIFNDGTAASTRKAFGLVGRGRQLSSLIIFLRISPVAYGASRYFSCDGVCSTPAVVESRGHGPSLSNWAGQAARGCCRRARALARLSRRQIPVHDSMVSTLAVHAYAVTAFRRSKPRCDGFPAVKGMMAFRRSKS